MIYVTHKVHITGGGVYYVADGWMSSVTIAALWISGVACLIGYNTYKWYKN